VVQRALFTGGSGRIIGPDAVVFDEAVDVPSRWSDNDTLFLRNLTLEDAEREILRLALRRHGGKRVAVSRELGITKNTLLRRIAEWGLQDEGREADEPEEPDDGSEAGDPA
jgi:DNA-binding NtrC family response regulator